MALEQDLENFLGRHPESKGSLLILSHVAFLPKNSKSPTQCATLFSVRGIVGSLPTLRILANVPNRRYERRIYNMIRFS